MSHSERGLTGVKALGWELIASRGLELDLLAISTHQSVLFGVEGQVARNGVGCDQLGGRDKCVGGWVAVIACSKVAVVGCNDGVGLACSMSPSLHSANSLNVHALVHA